MSSKSSCPEECGPPGDIIPMLKTDEHPADLSPKPHYSCFKPAGALSDKPEEEVENAASGKSEKEAEDTACDKPKEEAQNASCEKPEEEVEEIKALVEEDEDGKQKPKEIECSSLFNIADAKSGDVDRKRAPAPDALEDPLTDSTPDVEKLVQSAKNWSKKSPNTKSPNKSPRELLQSVPLPPEATQ